MDESDIPTDLTKMMRKLLLDYYSLTPIGKAIKDGNLDSLELLINLGADLNAREHNGLRPLHIAAEEGKEDGVVLLLSYGADIDGSSLDNRTALCFAAENGHLEVVKLLLQFEPDVNNEGNKKALYIAMNCHNKEMMVKSLLDYGFIYELESGCDPGFFHGAIELGFIEIVEDLLTYGADANASKGNDGETPLLMAVKGKQPDFAELLLYYGADVNAQDWRKKTPIHCAAESGNAKLFNILLTHGATISDHPDVVHAAVRGRSPEIVEQLLNLSNVHINECTYKGTPALLASLQRSCADVTALLLDKGACVNARSEKNHNTPLHLASASRDHGICETMLEKGAAVGSRNKKGRTPLYNATTVETVKLLLQFGADINARDRKGRTPLHIALKKKRENVVDALLKFDADVDLADKKGKTPLHFACRSLQPSMVRLLLIYGADINICDNSDDTPIDRAYSYFGPYCDDDKLNLIINEFFFHMKMFNLHVSDKNLASEREDHFLSEEVLTKQREECKEEIGKLQTTEIGNSNVTYYEFLTKNTNSRAFLLDNENILQAFQPEDANIEEFPNYAPMLKLQFRKAMERKGLVEQCYEVFGLLFHELPPLPTCCVEEIFQYLSNKDLKMFVADRAPVAPPSQCWIEEELMDDFIDDSSYWSEDDPEKHYVGYRRYRFIDSF